MNLIVSYGSSAGVIECRIVKASPLLESFGNERQQGNITAVGLASLWR